MELNPPLQLEGFRPLTIDDRAAFEGLLSLDPPRISELSFSNLFMWAHHYRPIWREYAGCLLVVVSPPGGEPFALEPHGPGDKAAALEHLLAALNQAVGSARLERVDCLYAQKHLDPERFGLSLQREQSDYLYRVDDLIKLAGRRFHRKKNHLNYFRKHYRFEYRPLDPTMLEEVRQMQTAWCDLRECHLDPGLKAEDYAVQRALDHFDRLSCLGGVLVVEGRVEAFSLGEPLRPEMVVIHIEKGNPHIKGIYAAMNQMFLEQTFSGFELVNREQDLGEPGLREAKESYRPVAMVDKFSAVLKV